MHKLSHTPENDIAKQPYRGPSTVAAAAGEGVVAHFKWAFIGLAGGGLAAYFAHNHLKAPVNWLRGHSNQWAKSESVFIRIPGRLTGFLFGKGPTAMPTQEKFNNVIEETRHGFGLWLFNHSLGRSTSFKQWMENKFDQKADQISMAFTGGGIFAFVGYFILPLVLSLRGIKKSNSARKDFEDAKDEIWDLRAQNDSLTHLNRDLKVQLIDSQTTAEAEQSKLRVSPDAPPVIRDELSAPAALADGAEHHDSPTSVSAPTPAAPPVNNRSAVDLESPGSVDTPRIGPAIPAAPPVNRSEESGVDLESPGSVDTPRIGPAIPAAPPVNKQTAAAKVERPAKGEGDWKELLQAQAEQQPRHAALTS